MTDTRPPCPRCRAAGIDARITVTDTTWICFTCGTTWQRGEHGQMVARRGA